jgi:glucose/arabinose dehydrogenase
MPSCLKLFAVAAAAAVLASGAARAQPLSVERVADGFDNPLFVTAPPGETDRLFVLEKDTGLIRIISGGTVLPTPFLDIGSDISTNSEQGLLGLAFHPDFAENGRFYVSFTRLAGGNVIREYQVSDTDPNVADPAFIQEVIAVFQQFDNHNGGMIAFSPTDGFLYLGVGDGGGANDPGDNGQDPTTLQGAMLRIDVDGTSPYDVPADNPFVGDPNGADEIWSYGLRNPWRFSFDRATGDLWIGDVGQETREEINFQRSDSPGGQNYGWNVAEGFVCRGGGGTCGTNPGFTPPLLDYPRSEGRSVTGGYVYRGSQIPALEGTYFYADFVFGSIWSLRYDASTDTISENVERTTELAPTTGAINNVVSFGEDGAGELYIVDFDGEIYRIVSDDGDDDGLTDSEEASLGTDRLVADTDGDGLDDGREVNEIGTNPVQADTDGDGIDDGTELAQGTDPLTPEAEALPLANVTAALLAALLAVAALRTRRAAIRA